MLIRQNIARLRREKGWTQEKLAEATGLSRGYIAAIEEGRKQPKSKTLSIIFKALDSELEKSQKKRRDHDRN